MKNVSYVRMGRLVLPSKSELIFCTAGTFPSQDEVKYQIIIKKKHWILFSSVKVSNDQVSLSDKEVNLIIKPAPNNWELKKKHPFII